MESSAGIVSKVVIAAPIIAMSIVGVMTRAATPNYSFVASSAEQQVAISSYAPIVREARAATRHPGSASPDVIRKIAEKWLVESKTGVLRPLAPCAYEDNSHEGVKSEILRANVAVAEALATIAMDERLAGQKEQAAKDATLGAILAQTAKFFDFASVSDCSIVQRRCLLQIKDVLPDLSPATRAEVEAKIATIRSSDNRLAGLAVRVRQLYLQYQLRKGEKLSRVMATGRALSPEKFTAQRDIEVVARNLRSELRDSRFQPCSEFLSDLRLGYQSQVDTDRKVAELFQFKPIWL
jgi:hypothetical protein